ncbi:MAG: hypothetical protein ABIH59_01790 [archaeon]
MGRTDLQYEISNYYNRQNSSFTRNVMFVDSEGRYYYPLCLLGDDELSIDVGGTDRQVPLAPHLNDLIDPKKV